MEAVTAVVLNFEFHVSLLHPLQSRKCLVGAAREFGYQISFGGGGFGAAREGENICGIVLPSHHQRSGTRIPHISEYRYRFTE